MIGRSVAGLQKPEMSNIEWPVFAASVELAFDVPGTFVEIGVFRAHSTRCVLQVLNAAGQRRRLVSIDPSGDAEIAHLSAKSEHEGACEATFVRAMSQDFGRSFGEPVAWLLVDGCHCYECVKEDAETWLPKAALNGVAVFHDTNERQKHPKIGFCYATGPTEKTIGVSRAVSESMLLRDHFALVASVEWPRTKYGIRVYRRTS